MKHGTVRKLPPPVARDADDRELLLQVVGYYNETLKQSPEAMKYLESRGLKSPEIIDRFRLGFANRTLGYRLPAKNRAAGAEMRGRLQTAGHPAGERTRALQRLAGYPGLQSRRRRGARCTGGRSRRICARERRTICTCQASIAACGTKRR